MLLFEVANEQQYGDFFLKLGFNSATYRCSGRDLSFSPQPVRHRRVEDQLGYMIGDHRQHRQRESGEVG